MTLRDTFVFSTETQRHRGGTEAAPVLLPYTFATMRTLTRITADPQQMGGRPCIRGIRVTVGTVVGLVASGHSREEILRLYPYLEDEDITEALAYAAWRADEFEVPISTT